MYNKFNHPDRDFWAAIDKRIKNSRNPITDAVIVSQEEFDKLDEYSTSVPTGIFAGKVWKRRTHTGYWILCRYTSDEGFIEKWELEIENSNTLDELPIELL